MTLPPSRRIIKTSMLPERQVQYQLAKAAASNLDWKMARILQRAAFHDNPSKAEGDIAPLYLMQARTLGKDFKLRQALSELLLST